MDGVGDNEDVRDAPLLADYSPPEIEDGVVAVDREKRARKMHEVLLIAVPEGLGLQLALEAVAKRSDEDDADHRKARNQGKATGNRQQATGEKARRRLRGRKMDRGTFSVQSEFKCPRLQAV